MREFTVQYLIGQDWHRISAIYDNVDDAAQHAKDLLIMGNCVRLLGRAAPSKTWHTIRLNDARVMLHYAVYGCPE